MADHQEFAQRLKQACDNHPHIPPHGKGQQVWFSNKLGISQEAVSRWFKGESKPQNKYSKRLSKLLEVDEAWLVLGVTADLNTKQKKQYSSRVEASAYILFGLFMANGHHCAFAADDNDAVDFYAIKGGIQRSISVTTGYHKSGDTYMIPVKSTYEDTVNVVIIPTDKTNYDILVLDNEGIEEHGERTGPMMKITAERGMTYMTGSHVWVSLEESDLV